MNTPSITPVKTTFKTRDLARAFCKTHSIKQSAISKDVDGIWQVILSNDVLPPVPETILQMSDDDLLDALLPTSEDKKAAILSISDINNEPLSTVWFDEYTEQLDILAIAQKTVESTFSPCSALLPQRATLHANGKAYMPTKHKGRGKTLDVSLIPKIVKNYLVSHGLMPVQA